MKNLLIAFSTLVIVQTASANYTETYYAACRICENDSDISIVATPFAYFPAAAERIESQSCDMYFENGGTKYDCKKALAVMNDVLNQYKATKLCPDLKAKQGP